ncbi:MAG: Kelch repeat-containing protein, partial [Planctomycetota bacterium]
MHAADEAPGLLHYQGRVQVDGVAVTGSAQIKAVLIDASGVTVWSNDGTSTFGSEPSAGVAVEVAGGLFALNLGDTAQGQLAVPVSAFATDEVYLHVWIDTGSGFVALPARRVTSSAWALSAARVQAGGVD